MEGVDHLDQMLGSYAYPHRATKWYQTLYHRVREIALTNGYILYKQDHTDNSVTTAKFREFPVDALRAEYVPVMLPRHDKSFKDATTTTMDVGG